MRKFFGHGESAKISPPVKDIFIGVFTGAVITIMSMFGLFEKSELFTLDSMFRLRGEREVRNDIVIIEIEDRSLEVLGRWPWPRAYHAGLLHILNTHGPKFVIFDILFPEADAEGDKVMAAAAKEIKNLYLASYFVLQDGGKPVSVPAAGSFNPPIPNFKYEITNEDRFLRASEIILPVEPLRKAAKRVSVVNSPLDIDGSIRRVPMAIEFNGKLYPTLSLQIACDYLGVRVKDIRIEPGFIVLPLKKNDIRIPVDSRGRMLLNFGGPINVFRRYSYVRLLNDYNEFFEGRDAGALEELKDRIVFVAHTATGSVDLRVTPFSNSFPAVGIHAAALNNILNGDLLRRAPAVCNAAGILLFSILLSLMAGRNKKAFVNMSIMLALFLTYAVLSFSLFAFLNFWLNAFAPLAAILSVYVFITVNQYGVIRHEKKLLENELFIARKIQQSFLPKSYPRVSFLEFAAACNPAKHIGGDLYDFVDLGDDRVGIVIGDVSGKGVPAALYMARAVSEFRTMSRMANDAASTLNLLNEAFVGEGMEKAFITMQYLVIDLKPKKIIFSNGGHNAVLHLIKNEMKVNEIDTNGGMPIGVIGNVEFDNAEILFDKGDLLFLYTDGITEAMDKRRREFGLKRVKNILLE
ncbi:MAG: CHASE2 domain-containing protein, partial [Candidatus Omnitrophota bacterium]|nr:CHASE2 domain-containing protein [Candidatus Omnitrophota bacterium]